MKITKKDEHIVNISHPSQTIYLNNIYYHTIIVSCNNLFDIKLIGLNCDRIVLHKPSVSINIINSNIKRLYHIKGELCNIKHTNDNVIVYNSVSPLTRCFIEVKKSEIIQRYMMYISI